MLGDLARDTRGGVPIAAFYRLQVFIDLRLQVARSQRKDQNKRAEADKQDP